jgi:hypothetical protein
MEVRVTHVNARMTGAVSPTLRSCYPRHSPGLNKVACGSKNIMPGGFSVRFTRKNGRGELYE